MSPKHRTMLICLLIFRVFEIPSELLHVMGLNMSLSARPTAPLQGPGAREREGDRKERLRRASFETE
ncbi:hypothetical protein AAFF_G00196560 [Aldrovandia affinis]|uniref:Uncharacterized protein n=1 Tax=Aldrovandia affinis TaxID=143900 RepID=A0AAD7W688_9TELE|nr:hypothetical protein AAFF_G00196560 [Aldrovandia affinis]